MVRVRFSRRSTGGPHRQAHRGQSFALILMGGLVSVGVLLFSVLQYGRVTGKEFSPDDFSCREFVYYEIPVLGIQVFPIDRKDCTNDLEKHLIREKLISDPTPAGGKRRWDLVMAARTNSSSKQVIFTEGEARILCAYLDAQDADKKNIWLEWTRKNQDMAKVVWPLVAKLARQELYFFVPDLLLAVRGTKDATTLAERLEGMLAERYLSLAQTQQELGRHAAAVELFTEAIAYSPQLAQAFSGRARSLAALGEQERATADLAQADKFGTRR